ncbi:CBASS cGAMP synthase [Mesorhizobium sp. M1273]|uniref:CBASS cGAMP synthase n=1 Tax=Mesorhizobium sp. M1273 TaxID=2957075 RepID=UPI00333B171C
MANVSKLLYSSTASAPHFLANIKAEDDDLRLARQLIRDHLRAAFEKGGVAAFGLAIRPRFFTQGSHAYRTLNDPAWTPPQQKDLDDGCYLPMSFVKGPGLVGRSKPSVAADAFFQFVDQALIELTAQQDGWRFVRKPTCARLIISKSAHVDVPLYAIPDAEFVQLQERVNKHILASEDAKRPDRWDALPEDAVLLAHREEDWIVSDPRKIHTWFLEAVDTYGEVLRRVCRYLKAWRDHHHPHLDSVSSILLMACAFMAFEEKTRQLLPSREDEILLLVVKRLPTLLNQDIANPAVSSENLNRMAAEQRKFAESKAEEFHSRLSHVVTTSTVAKDAVANMVFIFGERLPDRPDLVTIAETATVTILSQPRKEVAAPVVGRSTSG